MSNSLTTTDTNNHADTEITPAPHPGEILALEFLEPMNLTQYRLAQDIGVAESQISKLIHGKISLTAPLAVRLAAYFGNSAEFWSGIQQSYDLFHARLTIDVSNIPTRKIA
ncbi:HigA family addiction module antitoxin [Corynebacterium oculi]|uniref:Antitoxin HigA-1 n=1 Tax=Corynebacterium oculi TaxID=1544416 RepID=A0A0N8VZ97_9CORY|nr:HigA family addiction module antitoxin [Corynebacterium oculi]KQB83290.1 Antitoxin HigA-1 [Corynebacterium oculi]